MDPTTLVTFMFRAPREVRIVELLGSWDNFRAPYRMHHDRLRGPNFWTGCFKFENIIFDGERVQWDRPRTGGLKQGGTYWYYYRLNYDVDAFDHRQPHTTGCPLLPGQALNVIEVPCELQDPPSRCHSACGHDIMGSLANFPDPTALDPANKYAHVEPPPVSKLHSRCLSDEQLDGRLEGQPQSSRERAVSPLSAPQTAQDISESRAVSPPTRDSTRAASCDARLSSRQSQCSSSEAPPTALSAVSELGPLRPERRIALHSQASSSFEYLSNAYAAPLGAMEALGAALFASSLQVSEPSLASGAHTADRRRRDSTMSCGPTSVQNVQFYGSRPGTSVAEDEDVYQPRTYSIPNSNLSDPSPAVSPMSANFSHSQVHRQTIREQDSRGADGTSDEGNDAYELSSPTFSASTVSTNGHNTPFRLSVHEDRGLEHQYDLNVETDRQGHAAVPEEHILRRRPSLFERGLAMLRPPFTLNYSLPSISSESNHSLAKTITGRSRRPSGEETPALPLPSVAREDEGSMANAIFSELGFLSSSIS